MENPKIMAAEGCIQNCEKSLMEYQSYAKLFMIYFLPKIRISVSVLIYTFAGAFVLSFGTLQISAQSKTDEQFDPQKFEAEQARRAAERKEELRSVFAELNRKIELQPRDLEAIKLRAMYYAQIQEYQKAIDDYTRAIFIKPDDADSYSNRATYRETLEQHDLALADWTQVIKLDPRNYSAYVMRSTIYFGRQSYDKAIADLTSILEFKPDDAFSYQQRAIAYQFNKQYKNAIADYTRLIKLDPRSTFGYYGRAEVYKALGDGERAATEIRAAEKIIKERGF